MMFAVNVGRYNVPAICKAINSNSIIIFILPYYHDENDNELLEYGALCEYSSSGIRRYIFMEVSQDRATADCKTIPCGIYTYKHNNSSQIEQAVDIFKEYLTGKDSFIAIETEVYSGKQNINKIDYELRVIAV